MFDELHLPIHASQLYWRFLGVWFTKAERDDFLKSLPKDLRLRPPASGQAEQAHQDRWAALKGWVASPENRDSEAPVQARGGSGTARGGGHQERPSRGGHRPSERASTTGSGGGSKMRGGSHSRPPGGRPATAAVTVATPGAGAARQADEEDEEDWDEGAAADPPVAAANATGSLPERLRQYGARPDQPADETEYLRRRDYKECYECIQGVHFQPRHRPPTHTACPYHRTSPADPNDQLNCVRPARYRRK